MKNGKRPTVAQKKLMAACGLNSEEWLVSKDTPEVMIVVHRHLNRTWEIPKEGQ